MHLWSCWVTKVMMVVNVMSKNNVKPEIRFKNFTDAWEQRKLGELGSIGMNKRIFKEQTSEVGEIPFYKIGTFGGKADAFISRELFEDYKSKYPYPNIGDILISASGSIGRTVEYKGNDEYFQDSNIVWLRHKGRIDNSFLKQFYTIVKWLGLEGSTIKRLYNKNILNTTINLPSLVEQKKIGEFFNRIDDTIALHQHELTLLKQRKKAFLQKMFPKKGERNPELRLLNLDEEWRLQSIGHCFEERNERSSKGELLSVTINSGVVKASSLDRKDSSSNNKSNYKVVNEGDIAYNSMRMWQGASGLSLYNGIVSPAYTILVPKEKIDSHFFSYYFKLYYMIKTFQSNSQGLTSDTWNLKYPLIKKIPLSIPSYDEQIEISKFFKKIDEDIELHVQKLEKLKQMKKAFLQKMFV